jgi:hypothetical protein
MEKNLKYKLGKSDGEGVVSSLWGCLHWIEGDMAANYTPADELPTYTLTPMWLTEKEFLSLVEES